MSEHVPIKILLVEDNEGDAILTKLAFEKANIPVHVTIVIDGVEAMEYLRGKGEFSNAEKPDIILMDINMPRMSGKEALIEIKKDEDLKVIPVIMLTSSEAYMDILESYKHYANAYIVKPVTNEKFVEAAQTIEDFWLKISKLPGTT